MDSLVAAAVLGRRRRRGSHGKPAFDPRTLSGLKLWYHPAAADVVKDDTTGKVSRLIDLSGSGNDATQFTAASEPTWSSTLFGSYPSILGASGGSMAGPIVDISHGFTAVIRIDAPANIANEPNFLQIDDGTANRRLLIEAKSTGSIVAQVYQDHTTSIGWESASGFLTAGSPTLVTVVWDGTPSASGVHIYINGTASNPFSASGGTFTGITAPTIPVMIGPNFQGHIGDVLLFTTALTTTNRQALESALLGTTPLYVPPAPPPAFSGTVYVSTTGTATGQGTQASPIDEATFLSKGVGPGTTVTVRGGTYAQAWVVNFGGIEADPITIQVAAGEHVKLSNGYQCNGSDVTLTGVGLNSILEIYQTDTTRTTTQTGDPTDVPMAFTDCRIAGDRSYVIGAIVHDLGNGLVSQSGGSGAGFTDCIVYNSGWDGGDRGYGHNIYLHNDAANATKTLTRVVAFNSFAIGVQYFARDGGAAHIDMTDSAIFASGVSSATYGEQRNLVVTNASPIEDVTFDGNSIYRLGSGVFATFQLNDLDGVPATGVTITNNFVKGGVALYECDSYTATGNTLTTGGEVTSGGNGLLSFRLRPGGSFAEDTIDNNTYISVTGDTDPFYYFEDDSPGFINRDFTGWKADTGWDAGSTYTEGAPTTPVVKVAASDKETGRALVFCYNPAGSATLNIPASDFVGVLNTGDVYSVWHVYDVFGTPVIASATYDGGAITLPQTGYTAPTPTGYGTTPPSTSPKFNVFLVRKVA